jgi:hypothetical protein
MVGLCAFGCLGSRMFRLFLYLLSSASPLRVASRLVQELIFSLICRPTCSLDSITLATKSRRTLHIIADRWEDANGVHIERKVHFGEDADLRKIKAQYVPFHFPP